MIGDYLRSQFGTAVHYEGVLKEDWKMWAEDVKNKMGFLEWNTHDNPVIWSEVTGRYIGGCVEFRRWVENHFGKIDWKPIDGIDMQKVAAEMLQEHTSANKQIFADLSPCGPKVIAVVATPSTCISEVFRTLKAEQSPLFSKPPYLCINDYLPAEGSRATGSGDEEGKEEGKKQENAAGSTEGPLQLNPENFERAIREDRIVELEDSKGKRAVAVEVLRQQSASQDNRVLYFHATLRGCRTLRRSGVSSICLFLLPRNLDSVLSKAKSKQLKEQIHELVLSKMEKGLFDDVICSNDAYAVYHRLISTVHHVWEVNRARADHKEATWDAVQGSFLEEGQELKRLARAPTEENKE